LLNNFDGTPKSLHNHYWFQNENKGPYVFIPWDYNNLIMQKLCKVNNDTGMIEGYGDIDRGGTGGTFSAEPYYAGVCDAPPFQYLPRTLEERKLVCECVPEFSMFPDGLLTGPMPCKGVVSIVLSQSLVDDYFNHRNDVFQGKEINIKDEVKSMVESWSNQIRTHIDNTSSSIQYPTTGVWEKSIKKIPLLFNYGLDQLMNRKQNLNDDDIEAHWEWIKNRAKQMGKCDGATTVACQSNLDCQVEGCKNETNISFTMCYQKFCYSIRLKSEECYEDDVMQVLEDGWNCGGGMKYKQCKTKKEGSPSTTESEVSTAESSTTESEVSIAESTAESTAESEVSKHIFSKESTAESEVSTAESSTTEPEVSTAESKKVFSKTFGIAVILILLLFIL